MQFCSDTDYMIQAVTLYVYSRTCATYSQHLELLLSFLLLLAPARNSIVVLMS